MPTLTLNNLNSPKNLVCFNATPIVVNIANSSSNSNSYSKLVINLGGSTIKVGDTITVNGYTLTATDKLEKVNNRNFYCGSDKYFNAITLRNALRSVSEIDMNYKLIATEEQVEMVAKEALQVYNITLSTTASNLQHSIENSSYTESLVGKYQSKVYLDIYTSDNATQGKIKANNSTYKYLTTLAKEYYKNDISFNITPVLNAISKYDNTTAFKLVAYATVDDKYQYIGEITDNYIINGYLVNQGGTYINFSDKQTAIPAMNVDRGTPRSLYNDSLLYVYDNSIILTMFNINGITSASAKIKYLESDEVEIEEYTTTQTLTFDGSTNLTTFTIPLNEDHLRDSYFVDVELPFGTLRYNVINPPFANAKNNRVLWYNSYGGVSFFDFTAEQTDERKYNYSTYNKSILNYYTDDKSEQAIVYARDNEITVSLTSHLIEEDGLYQLYDLANSYKAWININGKDYNIIITSLTVDEPSDNVYTATIKYKYSLADNFV